jgi:hypothetical protein
MSPAATSPDIFSPLNMQASPCPRLSPADIAQADDPHEGGQIGKT